MVTATIKDVDISTSTLRAAAEAAFEQQGISPYVAVDVSRVALAARLHKILNDKEK